MTKWETPTPRNAKGRPATASCIISGITLSGRLRQSSGQANQPLPMVLPMRSIPRLRREPLNSARRAFSSRLVEVKNPGGERAAFSPARPMRVGMRLIPAAARRRLSRSFTAFALQPQSLPVRDGGSLWRTLRAEKSEPLQLSRFEL